MNSVISNLCSGGATGAAGIDLSTTRLAVVAAAGHLVVPVAVQQTLERGLGASGGPDLSFTVLMGVLAAVAIVVTSTASYFMTRRLFVSSERGLATLSNGANVDLTDVYFNVSSADAAKAGVTLPSLADLLGDDSSLDAVLGQEGADIGGGVHGIDLIKNMPNFGIQEPW